jgi:hypothetical protein
MRIRCPLTALALAAATLVLTACGGEGSGDGASAASSTQERNQQAMLDFARCMRRQGIDFPDPRSDENGFAIIEPGSGPPRDSAKVRAAERACEKHRANFVPPKLSEEEREEFREAALAHARCMREHGVDFPDPQFGEGGRASVRIGGRGGVDPNDPEFRAAEAACRDLMRPPGRREEGS